MRNRYPLFFVMGTQKAGTTSLHNWLVKQPRICLPVAKETQFFSDEKVYSRGIDWYQDQFANCSEDAVLGEVCPEYMYIEEAAYRIRQCISAPKIILVFRQPIERAYSHYLMTKRAGFEDKPFAEALRLESTRLANGEYLPRVYYSYMDRGDYSRQVKSLTILFPESRFLYIKFDDLFCTGLLGERTFARICEFIGVDMLDNQRDSRRPSNVASSPRLVWLRDLLYKPNLVRSIAGKLVFKQELKSRISAALDRLNRKAFSKGELIKVPKEFTNRAQLQINELQLLTGFDLRDWQERLEAQTSESQ